MSDSHFDEPQNIAVSERDNINAEIGKTSWTPTPKNISQAQGNTTRINQLSLLGGKNVTRIKKIVNYNIYNSDMSPNYTSLDLDPTEDFSDIIKTVKDTISAKSSEYFNIIIWSKINGRLHWWVDLNFPAAKQEYSDTLSNLFVDIFSD